MTKEIRAVVLGLLVVVIFGVGLAYWRRPGAEFRRIRAFHVQVKKKDGGETRTLSFNVPLGYYYNRRPNPYTGNRGDATFPRQIFLSSYAFRFGNKGQRPVTTAPSPDTSK